MPSGRQEIRLPCLFEYRNQIFFDINFGKILESLELRRGDMCSSPQNLDSLGVTRKILRKKELAAEIADRSSAANGLQVITEGEKPPSHFQLFAQSRLHRCDEQPLLRIRKAHNEIVQVLGPASLCLPRRPGRPSCFFRQTM